MRILAVDESYHSLQSLKDAFARSGMEVDLHVASCGADAAMLLSQRDRLPDLALIDLHMPRVGGAEVVKLLENTPALKHVITVLFVGGDGDTAMKRMPGVRSDHCCAKPQDAAGYDRLARDLQDLVRGVKLAQQATATRSGPVHPGDSKRRDPAKSGPSVTKPTAPVVLWVEDNPDDVVLMRQAFADAGLVAEMVVSENAVLAFRYMEEREPFTSAPRPALIIVDLNLPVMRGTVVLTELRRHQSWRHVPIVVLTSSENVKELQDCVDMGATECITKPRSFEGYLSIVERLRRHLPRGGDAKKALGPGVDSAR